MSKHEQETTMPETETKPTKEYELARENAQLNAKLKEFVDANRALAKQGKEITSLAVALLHHVCRDHYRATNVPDFGLSRRDVTLLAMRALELPSQAAVTVEAPNTDPVRRAHFGPFVVGARIECDGHLVKVTKVTPKTIVLRPVGVRNG